MSKLCVFVGAVLAISATGQDRRNVSTFNVAVEETIRLMKLEERSRKRVTCSDGSKFLTWHASRPPNGHYTCTHGVWVDDDLIRPAIIKRIDRLQKEIDKWLERTKEQK
jgi:hypothetical protein